jgi:hypothetical protein
MTVCTPQPVFLTYIYITAPLSVGVILTIISARVRKKLYSILPKPVSRRHFKAMIFVLSLGIISSLLVSIRVCNGPGHDLDLRNETEKTSVNPEKTYFEGFNADSGSLNSIRRVKTSFIRSSLIFINFS